MMRERVIHLWALICVLACLYLSSASNNSPANEGFCNSSIKSLHSDCTFMLGPGNDLCTIHHTNSCKTYDFGTWNMSPPHKIYALDDLDYEVFLKTYSYKYNHASALTLNISFSTSLRDVHGFGFTLVEYSFPDERKRYNTCRIFDFRKFSLKEHASVFYDCYYNIGGDNKNSFFLLTTRSLPANHLAEFFVTLSTSPVKQGGETLCNWESTVLILKPALAISSVELMFSVAKADLQVEHYSVSLVKHISSDSWQYAEQIVSVNPSVNSSKKFVVQKLGNVQPGKYHIEIHPVHPDWSGDLCSITKTDAFVLPAGEEDFGARPNRKASAAGGDVHKDLGILLAVFNTMVMSSETVVQTARGSSSVLGPTQERNRTCLSCSQPLDTCAWFDSRQFS